MSDSGRELLVQIGDPGPICRPRLGFILGFIFASEMNFDHRDGIDDETDLGPELSRHGRQRPGVHFLVVEPWLVRDFAGFGVGEDVDAVRGEVTVDVETDFGREREEGELGLRWLRGAHGV